MLNAILISTVALYYLFLIILMFYMFTARTKAVKEGRVSFKLFKSYSTKAPDDLVILQNNYNNHFQIPMFFTVACAISLSQNTVTTLTVFLAIFFVLTRAIHSYIHLGSNKLMYRACSFFSGVIIVAVLYLEIAYRAISRVI